MMIIPASKEMIAAHCPGKLSSFGLAAVENGKVLGVAGMYLQSDCQVMFSWIGDELKARPKTILKAWKMLLEMRFDLPLVARCDISIPKSELMLLHLGFKPYKGDIWKYEGRR